MINMIFLMVDIIIFVPPSISHSMIYGRLVYHGKVLDFPSVYHNVMGSSLPSFSPPFFEVRTFFNFMLLHILVYGEEQNTGLKFTLTNRHEVHVDVSDLI